MTLDDIPVDGVAVDGAPAVRRRNAARTRDDLRAAAEELFAERGYQRTTVRDIGDRAGVDPTLIARYFGSKARLYIETLKSGEFRWDAAEPADVRALLDYVRHYGTGPVVQAAVQSHDDAEVQEATLKALDERLVQPLRNRLSGPDADLRTEIAVAAIAGVALGMTSGAFATLATAEVGDVAAVVTAMVEAVRDK